MMRDPGAGRWMPAGLALLGIILVTFNLRTAVTNIPPLIDRIAVDYPIDTLSLSIIGATPSLAFAVFGLLTPGLSRRFGLEPTLLLALAVMTTGHILRGFTVDPVTLIGATVVTFAGIGVANVLLPALIKRYFPHRINVLTAVAGLIFGVSTATSAAVSPLIAEPLGWRFAVAGWSITAVISAVPWLLLLRRGRSLVDDDATDEPAVSSVGGEPEAGRIHRSITAWAVAVIFGTGAMTVFTFFVWMPSVLHDLTGISFAEAGSLLALFSLMGVPMNIAVIIFGGRQGAEPVLGAIGVLAFLVGLCGLLFVPSPWTLLWVVILGFGPFTSQVALIMVGTRTRSHRGTVALSTFAQSLGYCFGAAGPLLFGALHALTGSWIPPLTVFTVVLVLPAAALLVIRRPRFVEDEWLRR